MTMILSSNRWFLLAALLVSGALWLAVSSVMGNAVHILAKENFSWYRFGQVSIWLIAASFAWLMFISYVLSMNLQLPAKSQALGLCAVGVWVGVLLVLSAFGDEWLGSLGAAALIFSVIEIVVAVFLVAYLFRQSLPFIDLQNKALLVVMALIWLTATKAMFLCLSPGVSIRL